MTRTAILSDIHGNLPALEAILADARQQGIDRYVLLGDYVFDLPWSNEVCQALMALPNAVCIAGNKEDRLHELSLDDAAAEGCLQYGAVYQTLRDLRPEVLAWLKALPREARLPLENGGTLLLTHSARNTQPFWRDRFSSGGFFRRNESLTLTHADLLREFSEALASEDHASFLAGIDAQVLAFGHNHLQFWGRGQGRLVIDPGSVGVPLDFDIRPAYTILEERASGLRVEERRVEYDPEAAIQAAKTSEIYARGTIWCELVFRSMRLGRDYMSAFLRFVYALANRRGIAARPFPNDLWVESFEMFSAQLENGAFYPQADRA